ncbi:hypothetical protein [Brevundimonas sp.]|uniref:hypothetical protein n=1 Tax=Brevundimonas sp. TaxID=1871086 RepID=UPI0026310B7E|nr:hypothetical protein [Brevundimonas sp.]
MDLLLETAGSAFGYGLIGMLVALVIKAFRRSRPMPKWPIIFFAVLGVLVRFGPQAAYTNAAS